MSAWLRRNPVLVGVLAGLLTAGLISRADVLSNPATGGGTASGITIGTTTTASGTSTRVLFDNAGVVGETSALTVATDGSVVTANTATTFRAAPSGGSATSNFLRVAGTLPATLTAEGDAVRLDIAGAGSSSQINTALRVAYAAGYTGSSITTAGYFTNANVGSGATGLNSGVFGIYVSSSGATAQSVAIQGAAANSGANSTSIGVQGVNFNPTGTGTNGIGGYFASGGTVANQVGVYAAIQAGGTAYPTFTSAALIADNFAVAAPILIARDNGAALPTTGATATTTILDGAHIQDGNGVLTSATMTAETQGQVRKVIHSYTWSNAQVAALSGTAGDITVATLPAKTAVTNAYIVITGAAAGPATVTVSCGDANDGTPFIGYIVASDAKAAANTVYGDASAERGASLTGYYIGSYTGTTLVTCHFISTVANLSTVTGSTGRVILETTLLP